MAEMAYGSPEIDEHLNILLDSKHMIENIIKHMNMYTSNYADPIINESKKPALGDIKNIQSTLQKISQTMKLDDNFKPKI